MGKMGRPIIGEAKNRNIKARIDSSLWSELNEYCNSVNVSMSDIIRMTLQEFLNNKKGLLHRQVN